MKYRNITGSAVVAIMFLMATSCGDKDNQTVIETPVGGKGGAVTLLVTPQHHERNIDSCTIYISYNATSKSRFDDSAKCVMMSGKPVASFSGLKKGNYYLYGLGWDDNYDVV